MTIVCGDSHTSTHGAFGALAFGIGTSEVEHVLATQTLYQKRPANMRITVDGDLPLGVTAKDVVLAIIGKIGTAGGTGSCHRVSRATPCKNLSMEASHVHLQHGHRGGRARRTSSRPIEVTFEYLKGRPMSPKGEAWEQGGGVFWKTLASDEGLVV